jgi:Spy/CpxP family protein refolding chaperone
MKATVLALFAAFGLSGTAFAQMGPGGSEGFDHGHLKMLLKIAELTPEQKAQAHQIMADAHGKTRPMVKQLHDLYQQLSDRIVSPGSLQLSDLQPLRLQIRDLQHQVNDQILGGVLQIRALLRPDQMKKVADAHVKMKDLHQQMDDLTGPPDEGEGEPVR